MWEPEPCVLDLSDVDPFDRIAVVYRKDGTAPTQTQSFDAVLAGEDVLPGFEFNPRALP